VKFYLPEKGPILYDGVRQYLQEDLNYLLHLESEIARQRTIYRIVEHDPPRRKHIERLEELRSDARFKFLKKWDTKK
jgi:hypothetical protein